MGNLIFDRRITFHAGDGDDIHIQRAELRQRGQSGLQANSGEPGVDADGQIIGHDFEDMVADFLRVAAVIGEPLQVGDQDKLLVVVLQRDALAQRADVVAKMQLAGRPVAGEDGLWMVHQGLLIRLFSRKTS